MKIIFIVHNGEPGGSQDKAIDDIMQQYKAELISSGCFLPTNERDLEYRVKDSQVKEVAERLKKLGFVVGILE